MNSKLQPYVGLIVLVSFAGVNAGFQSGRDYAAIVTEVHTEDMVTVTAFGDTEPAQFRSVPREGVMSGAAFEWKLTQDHAHFDAIAGRVTPLEPIMGESLHAENGYGAGFNPLSLLGGLDGVLTTVIATLYLGNRDKIAGGAERIFTLSDKGVQLLAGRLGIHERADIERLDSAFEAFGEAAGQIFTTIADIKAEG